MKITHLIFSFTTGGAETMLVDIMNKQVNYAEINIIIINSVYNDDLLAKIDKRVVVRFINRKKGSRNFMPIIRLNRLLLKMKSDVLHCHSHDIIPLLVSSLKRKSVLTIHDVNITTRYFKQYKKIFAISQCVKEDIYKRSGIIANLVYNGICTEAVLKKKNITDPDIFKIVLISRLQHEKKGQHLAIEALKLLKGAGMINISLDLIGSGDSEQYLKDITEKYELSDQVNFLGLKDREYIYTNLENYDLLIQPSLYEGFGLTVAEGMAAKVPVLVSDNDGPIEIIEHGKYGFYFQAGNVLKLAEQLKYIIEIYNSEKVKQKVELAYAHVVEKYDVLTTASKYLRNY